MWSACRRWAIAKVAWLMVALRGIQTMDKPRDVDPGFVTVPSGTPLLVIGNQFCLIPGSKLVF